MSRFKYLNAAKIIEYIYKENPTLIEDAENNVKKIAPYYNYYSTLYYVFDIFLAKRNIVKNYIQGKNICRQAIQERKLFIAIVLWLYSPNIYNIKVNYNMHYTLRHELEGILLCNETWISQQVKVIAFQYNNNYQDFRDQVNELLIYIKSNVIEKKIIDENISK